MKWKIREKSNLMHCIVEYCDMTSNWSRSSIVPETFKDATEASKAIRHKVGSGYSHRYRIVKIEEVRTVVKPPDITYEVWRRSAILNRREDAEKLVRESGGEIRKIES
jgi:hypothetical protein